MNSGKPLQMPCPDNIAFTSEILQERESYYWQFSHMGRSKTVHPYFPDSIIPFLILQGFFASINTVSIEAKTNLEQFKKNITVLKLL